MVTKKLSLYGKLSKAMVVLLSFYFAFPVIVQAQTPKKANIWYFGDRAGVDFTSGNPVALTDGAMQSFEGSAVASNISGELLFYSNGGSTPFAGGVWNRNHQMMPNGNLAGAGGCNSSFQSSLIVPLPRSESKHYLFTTDCMENNAFGGLRYNIVDMNLDGGLGDVVVKGQKLTGPVDESLTAIQHKNGQDWWIVSHKLNTDSFYVYSLTPAGITGVVKTKVGLSTPDNAGAIVASSNGEKVVHCGLSFTTLYTFNKETGKFSNPVYLGTPGYSAAFSADCKVLYVGNGMGKTIYQYDLTATDISASKVVVGTTTADGVGYMQLAPNGKIYVSKYSNATHLGVINQPSKKGVTCFYADNALDLGGRLAKGGLPNFPNNYVGECADSPVENTVGTAANPSIRYLTGSGVTIGWAPGGSGNFTVLFRKKGDTEWTNMEAAKNQATIGGLIENNEYELKIVSNEVRDENYEMVTGHLVSDLISAENEIDAPHIVIDKGTSVSPITKQGFSISPNPAGQETSLSFFVGRTVVNASVQVTDLNGNEMFSETFTGVTGNANLSLDLSTLTAGTYFVTVSTSGRNGVKALGTKKLFVTQ